MSVVASGIAGKPRRSTLLAKLGAALKERFSPLGISVFLCATVITLHKLYGLSVGMRFRDDYLDISNDDLTALVCFCLMLACSLTFMILKSRVLFHAALALKLGLIALYLVTIKSLAPEDYAAIAIFLVEIAVYLAFYLNAIACAAVVALTQLIVATNYLLAKHEALTPASYAVQLGEQLPGIMVLALLSALSCLLVYYREKTVNLSDKTGQLDSVVARLTATNLGYQNYAHEAAARSQIEERQRITRELHDIVGYTFTNNIMMMEAAVTKIHKDPDRVQKLIGLARQNAQTGLQKIRDSLYLLRSSEPKPTTIDERIRHMCNVFEIATRVKVQLDFGNLAMHLPEKVESFLYYFVQECLTNAFLHGGATRVEVRFLKTERVLIASAVDNGKGANLINEGIGISGMRERLAPLNGSLSIKNMGYGFEMIGEVPYDHDEITGLNQGPHHV